MALLIFLCLLIVPIVGVVSIAIVTGRDWRQRLAARACINCGYDDAITTPDGQCVECGLTNEQAVDRRDHFPFWWRVAMVAPSALVGLLPIVLFPDWPHGVKAYYWCAGLIPAALLVGMSFSPLRRYRGLAIATLIVPALLSSGFYAVLIVDQLTPSPPPPVAEEYADLLRRNITPVVNALVGIAGSGTFFLLAAAAMSLRNRVREQPN